MSGFTPEQLAKINQRINHKRFVEPTDYPGRSGVTSDDRARDAEVAEFKANPQPSVPQFPRALVTAAVRAADVLMPDELERRVTQIAFHYLNGKKCAEIAKILDIDPHVVQEEVRRLDSARAVAYRENPELAVAVTNVQVDVLQKTVDLSNDMLEVLSMVKEEMVDKHTRFKELKEKRIYGLDNLSDEEKKELKDNAKGISPLLLQSYTAGIEAVGKQYDRIGELTGQLGKHAHKGDTNLTQINATVQFGSEQLNNLVDLFLQSTGQSAMSAHSAPIDVTPRP